MATSAPIVQDVVIESGGSMRCFRCSKFIGEPDTRVELIGIGRGKEFTDMVTGPKLVIPCKCGWLNVFKRR
jgi:hypothetical protein